MILRARFIVPMDGPPVENGAVAVSHGRITAIGSERDVCALDAGPVLDLGDVALLPGLVNAHCHLDYTCLRDRIEAPQDSFAEWIKAINAAKTKLTPNDYQTSINAGFAEAKRFGTRALANLTAFPNLIRQTNATVKTTWFA